MKTVLTKILFLILIMSVSIFFIGCNKNNKTVNQNNNEQDNNNSMLPVSDQNDENDLATDQSETEENSEIATIEKYYSFLSDNNLEGAYQMRSDQTETSYEKFKGWYANAQYLKPSDFNKTSSGSYQFYVDYKDRNGIATRFKVEMLVIEDKIKTLSSVEVKEGEEKSEEDVSDWLVYTNEKFKYKISYPKTYIVTEYQDFKSIEISFKNTNNENYHGGEISIRVGDSADTIDSVLTEIKEECDKYGLCADISENKIVDLSNVKGVRKITRSTAIGGYMTSYLFTREEGWQLNFELSLNWEDEVREKIIDSFEFF